VNQEVTMKYACFGYVDEAKFEKIPEAEMNAMMDECFAYDDELRKGGHFAGGEGLQSARNTTTLRYQNGKVTVTDGPFVETKEQVGGILFLEAKDLNEAIQLLSRHPGAKIGPWEIRPIEDMTPILRASEERRRAAVK
jgi:hypothetical protein